MVRPIEPLEGRLLLAANLVAAYAFDEGAGSAAADASGVGNNGTLAGPTWVAGKNGGALSFDGVNDWVTVADAASLDLTTAMTLEAWVKPTALANWRTVLLKERSGGLSYALYGSDSASRPSVFAYNGSDRDATGPSALPLNVWTHLAGTYDGATLRIYVNGVQAASSATTGAMTTSTGPLRIGGNAVWTEFFAGVIDDVRVYSRALPASEIQADMNTPVGTATPPPPPPTETVPPTVLSATPANGAVNVAGATNVVVTFSEAMTAASINSSTVELRDPAGALVPATVTYNAATNTATLDPTPTLPVATGYYTARVRGGTSGVKDAAGNALAADLDWYFSTGPVPAFRESVVFGQSTAPAEPTAQLVEPTVVRFSPDGRVFVAEKSGLIKVFDSLADKTATVFADLRTQVHNFWDRGLLGMALHPNFPATPNIYVLYTYDGDIGGAAPKYGTVGGTSDPGPDATGQGAKVSGRLSRLTASGNVAVGGETVLIHDWAQQFPSHSIGSLQFGADGALYASGGDGASFNYTDYGQTGNPFGDPGGPAGTNLTPPTAEGGALRSQDLLSPGDPTTLDGSVIRINPDTGAAMAGNPLIGSADLNARRIVAEGLRNPFRFTMRPGTNELWIGDVGWGTWEEINRITVPTAPAYTNFGWPAYEGAARQGGYDGANLTLLENFYNNPAAHTAPHYAYNHSAQVVAGSGEPTGGSSISGLAFYNGGTYPGAFNGALFFSDYSRDRIYVMFRGPDGNPNPNNRAMFVGPASNPVNLEIGPGGDLFYVDLAGAIRRISASGTPTALARATPTSGPAPLNVTFDATGSTDPDGDPLTYAWDFDNDGQYDDSTASRPTFTFNTPGNHTVGLQVNDGRGGVDTDSIVISVNNTAPTAVINTPSATLLWKVGDSVSFAGQGNDPEEGTLPASRLSWSLVLLHGTAGTPGYHEHPVQTFSGVAGGSFIAPDHEYPSKLQLRLTATDSGGLSNTAVVDLEPLTVGLAFETSPSGLTVVFNGASAAAPFTRTVIAGSANSVSATSPQTLGGTSYNFSSWSDGGAATHNLVAPESGGTYTATYTAAPPPPPSTGLVAAYGFDEGSGTAAGDSSGTGNGGTLSGATWATAGKFGGALSFDGVNDLVSIADSSSLDLSVGMTLEAWVRPASLAGPDTVLFKERARKGLAYGLYAANGGNLPPAGYVYRNANVSAVGTSALPLNTWSHLAATYDGAALRLYVNGTLSATRAVTGALPATGRALRIGGNTVFGEYFSGLIDEVRVYNRALGQAEIQADMGRGVAGGAAAMTLSVAPSTAALTAGGAAGDGASRAAAGVLEVEDSASTTRERDRKQKRKHRRHQRRLTIADAGAVRVKYQVDRAGPASRPGA